MKGAFECKNFHLMRRGMLGCASWISWPIELRQFCWHYSEQTQIKMLRINHQRSPFQAVLNLIPHDLAAGKGGKKVALIRAWSFSSHPATDSFVAG